MGQHGYENGDIGWMQLNTTDADSAISFYTELCGWEKREGPFPGYHVIANGDENLGGITGLPEGESRPHWIPYVTVSDADAIIAKAGSLGGSLLVPPSDLPDGGKFAVISDPQGGAIGVAQYGHGPGEH